MARRVVVTGMSAFSPLGLTPQEQFESLKPCRNFIKYMAEWDIYKGLNTRLAAPILNFEKPEHYGRKDIRSMGRVAMLSTYSTELALKDAGLYGDDEIKDGTAGVAYGSSSGSVDAIKDFYSMLETHAVSNVTSSTYIKMMSHTCAVNIAVHFKITGRLIPTGTACTSGSLAIGAGYEAIKFGLQDIMIVGGAEELSPTQSAVFDTLYATSTKTNPSLTPRPFDKDRDGLVIGEGAGTLVLEEYEHAKARGAKIYAEVAGYATNTDGTHITQPNAQTMAIAINKSLQSANLSGEAIEYVSAHGTATGLGDIAESHATRAAFGRKVTVSSLKSYIGHTLGACGAIEAVTAIEMLHNNWYHPTLNLTEPDEKCAELDYITGTGRVMDIAYVMSNNFAFGGINTSLIFKRL